MTLASILASSTLAQAGAAAPAAAPAQTNGVVAPSDTATATAAPAGAGQQPQGGAFGGMGMALPIILIGGMFLMMWFTNRKEKKKREEMMMKMQKGAKVTTIGGAKGRIVELTDAEAVIKFEDCTIAFSRSAIATVDEVPA